MVEKNAILVACNQLSKIAYFVVIIEEISTEGLVRLFKNNMWKLYGLSESIISDRGPQFAAELMKELNRILEIETRLSTVFYSQYYNLDSSNKAKEKFCIEFIQENLIEFQVQSVYLTYIWLIVYSTINLVYSKRHMYYILLIYRHYYSKIFYVLLCDM